MDSKETLEESKKTNWWLPISIVILLVVLIGGLAWWQKTKAPKEDIKIGMVAPMSGPLSFYGTSEKTVTEYAINEINSAGGIKGRKIQIIYEDGKCNGADSLTAAKKLIDVDNVLLILGGSCSSETLSIAPYAKEKNALLFTSISSAPDISKMGNVFRNTIITTKEGELLAELANEKYSRVAILTENNDFPVSIKKGFTDIFSASKIVSDLTFTVGEKDFRSYLTKIKAANPDALIILGLAGNTVGPAVNQAKELGITAQILGAEVPTTSDFLDVTKEQANGIIFTDIPNIDEENTKLKEILQYYVTNNTVPIANYSTAARYDMVQVIKDALENCGENNSCIANHIKSQKYEGLVGKFSFDSNGDIVGLNTSLKQIINGKSVPYNLNN